MRSKVREDNAMTDAITAMHHMMPNGRDYYPQGDNVINQAITEHRDRLNRAQALLHEMYEVFQGIDPAN